MPAITPRYDLPWPTGKLLSSENLTDRLEADPHNLIRNADFRMATYQSATEADFPYWSLGVDPAGNPAPKSDGDTVRRCDLPERGILTQDIHQLFGGDTTSWTLRPMVLAIVVEFVDAAGRGRVDVSYSSDVSVVGDTMLLDAASLPNTVQLVYGFTSGDSPGTATRISIRNTGTGVMRVHFVHLGFGTQLPQIVPQRMAAGGGLVWLGAHDDAGAAIEAPSGCRVMRLEDVAVTVAGGGTAGTATVDLAADWPTGCFVSGDEAVAFVTVDSSGTAGNLRRVGYVGASISGTTLTLAVNSLTGVTFVAGNVTVNAIILVFPQPAAVGSRGASRRAYPYT